MVKRFLSCVALAALASCGSDDETLSDQSQSVLSGKWAGPLTFVGGSCTKEVKEPIFGTQVVVEGQTVDVDLAASDLFTFGDDDPSASDSPKGPQQMRLEGETTGDGGFVVDMIDDGCPRCPSAKLILYPPHIEAARDCDSAGVCKDAWVSDAEFTYVPLNGPGGCIANWHGELVKKQ